MKKKFVVDFIGNDQLTPIINKVNGQLIGLKNTIKNAQQPLQQMQDATIKYSKTMNGMNIQTKGTNLEFTRMTKITSKLRTNVQGLERAGMGAWMGFLSLGFTAMLINRELVGFGTTATKVYTDIVGLNDELAQSIKGMDYQWKAYQLEWSKNYGPTLMEGEMRLQAIKARILDFFGPMMGWIPLIGAAAERFGFLALGMYGIWKVGFLLKGMLSKLTLIIMNLSGQLGTLAGTTYTTSGAMMYGAVTTDAYGGAAIVSTTANVGFAASLKAVAAAAWAAMAPLLPFLAIALAVGAALGAMYILQKKNAEAAELQSGAVKGLTEEQRKMWEESKWKEASQKAFDESPIKKTIRDYLLLPVTFSTFWENIKLWRDKLKEIDWGEKWQGAVDLVKEKWGNITEWVKEKWGTITEWVNTNVIEPIKEKWGTITEWVNTNVIEPIKEKWGNITEWVNTNVIEPIKEKWDIFKTWWTDVFIVKLKSGLGSLVDKAKGVWNDITEIFSKPIKIVVTIFKDISKGISSTFSKLTGRQFGGYIPHTGPYLLHAGEMVVPKHKTGRMSSNIFSPTVNVSVNSNVSSNVDIDRLAEKVGRITVDKMRREVTF